MGYMATPKVRCGTGTGAGSAERVRRSVTTILAKYTHETFDINLYHTTTYDNGKICFHWRGARKRYIYRL